MNLKGKFKVEVWSNVWNKFHSVLKFNFSEILVFGIFSLKKVFQFWRRSISGQKSDRHYLLTIYIESIIMTFVKSLSHLPLDSVFEWSIKNNRTGVPGSWIPEGGLRDWNKDGNSSTFRRMELFPLWGRWGLNVTLFHSFSTLSDVGDNYYFHFIFFESGTF